MKEHLTIKEYIDGNFTVYCLGWDHALEMCWGENMSCEPLRTIYNIKTVRRYRTTYDIIQIRINVNGIDVNL